MAKGAYEGCQDGHGLTFGVVVSRFNGFITERLLRGALDTLKAHGVREEDVSVAYVPGAFELPLIAKKMAESRKYHAVLCLGAVIRGETPHFDYVATNTSRGILQAGMETGVPVIFGVLTTNTVEQARNRAGEQLGNRGADFALAAIEMATLLRALEGDGTG